MTEPYFASDATGLTERNTMLALSGLSFMEAMLAGKVAHPPIAATLGFRLTLVEPGRVQFTGTPGFRALNPMGGVHGGWFGTLLDSAMGCAVMTNVPKGSVYTTLEYKVNITRALRPDVAAIAEGVVQHVGRSTAVAAGTLRGVSDGRLYATGATTCLIMKAT